MSGESLTLHACCVLLGEGGVLIRGVSGSGKSSLARRLVAARRAAGGFAAFVADDRVVVVARHRRLVARPHPLIAGLGEHRGLGIRTFPYEKAAVLRLVLDVTADPAPRMPDASDFEATLLGIRLPRLAGQSSEAAALVEATLSWQ